MLALTLGYDAIPVDHKCPRCRILLPIFSFECCQAQLQAKHLALLHQKHSSLAAASTITQSTQTSTAAAAADNAARAAIIAQQQQQQAAAAAAKNVNVPLSGQLSEFVVIVKHLSSLYRFSQSM